MITYDVMEAACKGRGLSRGTRALHEQQVFQGPGDAALTANDGLAVDINQWRRLPYSCGSVNSYEQLAAEAGTFW